MNNNIINKWFYLNPVFCLFTDSPISLKILKKNLDEKSKNDSTDLLSLYLSKRQIRTRFAYKIESELISDLDAKKLRKNFQNIFLEIILTSRFEDEDEETSQTPIALLTFVLSIFLSIDNELRLAFYYFLKGKIPSVTQLCLETFRVSPVGESEWVGLFAFLEEYQDTKAWGGLGATILDINYLKRPYFSYILFWFLLLDEHFNTNPTPYMEWVEFKPIPFVSKEKNYFCSLTVGNNGKVSWSKNSYFNEVSDKKKETYIMLAKVLDCVCQNANDGDLPNPHKNILQREFDEKIIIPQLIKFIVTDCKNFLLRKKQTVVITHDRVIGLIILLLGVNLILIVFEIFKNFR